MRQIVGALASLTVIVTLWAAFADDSQNVQVDRVVPDRLVQFTPEQQEFACEVLDEIGWILLEAIQSYVNFENPAADEWVEGGLSVEFNSEVAEFRAMLKPELLFVRKACDLPEPEFQTLSQSCEKSLSGVVEQFVAEQEQLEQELNNGKMPKTELKPLVQRIRESVSQTAECQLTPEQWERCSTELQLRSAHRKRVAILSLVARLDHDLRLSATQREQFTKLFEDNWRESWGQSLGPYSEESSFMPDLAEEDVRPILSPTQFAVLSELPYDSEVSNWGDDSVGFELEELVDEVMADDDPPADGKAPQEPNALKSDQ